MFELICKYIDRLVGVVRPRKLLYMAVDGVAPRAKMNQQRGRRFKAAEERLEMEQVEEKLRKRLQNRGLRVPPKKKPSWDHNVITPGTPFMMKLSKHFQHSYMLRICLFDLIHFLDKTNLLLCINCLHQQK